MRQELKDIEKRMADAVAALKERFKTLRTGRANLGMLDGVLVSAYGAYGDGLTWMSGRA